MNYILFKKNPLTTGMGGSNPGRDKERERERELKQMGCVLSSDSSDDFSDTLNSPP
jgi:hypothetical protein